VIYPAHFEQKLGFDKIRGFLREKCLSTLGEEKVNEISFSSSFVEINEWLLQTEEFVRVLQEEDSFPASYFFDVRPALKRIRVEGMYLSEDELHDLRRSLDTIRAILAFLNRKGEEVALYPALRRLAGEVMVFPELIAGIDGILNKFGKVKDNASADLARIRRELVSTSSGISRSLSSILNKARAEGYVESDVTPTMRDGRLVIPVMPSYKRKIKGIVHDESASGKTVYIEPAEVVEANNRIRELEIEEKREIIRILTAFADTLRPYVPDVVYSYLFLAEIDFIRAKALFALETESIRPPLEDKPMVDWGRAMHPLLFLSLKKHNKRVVPLDIFLNDKQRILIISGPNAGGKSVCLKTVGLLQYMLQCGLLVSMHESSQAGIFERLFVDIGDEQSIENDLSTYSSHLQNMKFFLKNSQEKTLILIDEFGTGTEPQIGGAIAEAVLEKVYANQSYGVITTHYRNLKHFAEGHDGVINGAMLYDRHEMRPLFQLNIGNPGSSFAIEIARKIGLPEDVIQSATDKVGQDFIDLDKYLQDIARDKRYWEGKRQSIRQKEKKLEELTEGYESELQTMDKQRKQLIKEAKQQADSLLKEANARIENTIREIKEAAAEKEKTKDIRRKLEDFKKEVLSEDLQEEDAIARKMRKIKERQLHQKEKKPLQNEFQPFVFKVGDAVRLKGQTSQGQILELSGKNVLVAFGMLKSTVPLDKLEKVSNRALKKESQKVSFVGSVTMDQVHTKKLNFKQEIDVRGMRGDEAMQAVTYYIDDAIQVGVAQVRIVHGTGTGILKQLIRNYLKVTPGVNSFRDEHVQFGGAGVTVVEFD
jgi:DNA mismatch repair protein MutS2